MAAQMAAAARAGSPPGPPSTTPPVAPSPPSASPRRRRKAPWLILGILLAVLAAAFAGRYVAQWYFDSGPGKTVTIPKVVGQSAMDAEAAISAAGLKFVVADEQYDERAPAQTVISTDPVGGESAKPGSTVSVVVSKGPERYDVPSLKGQTQAAATVALTDAKLSVGAVTQDYDDKVAAGSVKSSSPKAGASVKPGTAVDLVVSKGPEPVPVPNVEGKKVGAAKTSLSAAGLKVDVTQKYSESVPRNTVMNVKPKAGTIVDSGSKVTLVVSKGPPPVPVPNLIDMNKDKAIATLRNLGLKAKVVQGAATPLNRVYSQDPKAGTEIPKGSTVTIRVI
jgi:serine/threonine-protein kinase